MTSLILTYYSSFIIYKLLSRKGKKDRKEKKGREGREEERKEKDGKKVG